jgi:large subunit ribosomal protein L18
MLEAKQKRIRRHKRVRAKISGTADRPRLCVFYSNNHVYAQLINDEKGATLAAVNDFDIKPGAAKKIESSKDSKAAERTSKAGVSYGVGKLIAKKAAELKIEKIVFDRGGFKYHGVVKALAEGAREGGLKF